MNYWESPMNWPLARGWECETCGHCPVGIDGIGLLYSGLTWGLIHAQCRCNQCHTKYRMRNEEDNVVTVPICQLKEEYKERAKKGWQQYQKPIDEWTEDMWSEVNDESL